MAVVVIDLDLEVVVIETIIDQIMVDDDVGISKTIV